MPLIFKKRLTGEEMRSQTLVEAFEHAPLLRMKQNGKERNICLECSQISKNPKRSEYLFILSYHQHPF